MGKSHTVQLEGRTYTWNGESWFDAKTYQAPPKVTVHQLNLRLEEILGPEDENINDPQLLLERAKAARDAEQNRRAERLVLRVLEMLPEHEGALAVYSSLLRRRGAAEKALRVAERVRYSRYPPLIISRAAALCDLGRWAEAKKVAGVALAIAKGKAPEAFAVVNRIKKARPDLYES